MVVSVYGLDSLKNELWRNDKDSVMNIKKVYFGSFIQIVKKLGGHIINANSSLG